MTSNERPDEWQCDCPSGLKFDRSWNPLRLVACTTCGRGRPEEVTKNLEINGQRRRLVLAIEAGDKTCAHAYGKFCPDMIHTLTGEAQCHLFGVPLYAFEDGSLKGWTARCDACLKAEREDET